MRKPFYVAKPEREAFTPEIKTPKEGVIENYLVKGKYSGKKSDQRKEIINKKIVKAVAGKYLDAFIHHSYSY